MATKEKRIFAALKKDVDAIVLMNASEPNLDLSFFYATGISNGLFEGCVAVLRHNGTEVLSSKLEELSSRKAGVKTTAFKTGKHRDELLKKKLKGMTRIGVCYDGLTHGNFREIRKCAKGARLVDVSRAIDDARMIKDRNEIRLLHKAGQIASKTADSIPSLVRKGQTETEAAGELNYMMMKLGADGPSFDTNASFGPATAEPHYVPGPRRLRWGQLALFDFGARFRKYASDITRTYVSGTPSRRQKAMYETVLDAQLAALDAIRAGAHGKQVDRAAREIVDKSEFKGRFIHNTGHGLGVSVHDPGSLSPLKDMILKEGMVLTVEPGVYVKGFGGVRIEDDILVTRSGCKLLTSASKEFICI